MVGHMAAQFVPYRTSLVSLCEVNLVSDCGRANLWGRGLIVSGYQQWIEATIAKAPKLSKRQVAEARLIIHAPPEVDAGEADRLLPPALPHREGNYCAEHADQCPLAV